MSKLTDVEGKGRIYNNVPTMLEKKFGVPAEKINVQTLVEEVGISHVAVRNWVKSRLTRRDDESLIAWCHYFGCGTGDILIYVPPSQKQKKAG